MKRLSKPITALKPEYDVVIIGSGYGGSIAASRFSRAGLNVCLLEKGKEFQPGEYPDSLAEAQKEMQFNTDKREARENGLYEFHLSENISVFKGCGLGGTSLVNANVSIKPEDRVFEDEAWPAAIRNDRQGLDEGYEKARAMLKPSPYPAGKDGFPELAKTHAMKITAEKMKEPFRYAEINVCFEEGINHAGVQQHACNNCGDCVTGCNYSAKNTLIMNYLPDAVNHSAEIFCNVNVNHIEQAAGKWVVYFNVFNTDRDKFESPPMFIRAANIIVSGGTLGSTEILLRSKAKGLEVSSKLGSHFTGNGDVLGFAYNCNEEINGIGLGKLSQGEECKPVGPCITGIIDMRNREKLEEGMTVEEGSIPAPLAGLINISLMSLSTAIGVDTDGGFSDWLKECGEEAESLIRGPYHGATNRTQTYLVMTHDDGQGQINLKNGRLNIDWPDVGSQPVFKKVSDALLKATSTLGGTYIRNIVWDKLLGYDLITVHPLGGCCMADDASKGVTDDTGNVFFGDSGTHTHPGLYVLDGSIVPRPLGTNPLFTISALTERACKLILQKMGKTVSYDFPAVASFPGIAPAPVVEVAAAPEGTPASAPSSPEVTPTPVVEVTPTPGASASPASAAATASGPAAEVQFTETMRGFFSKTEKEDFEKGYRSGQQHCSPFLFTLTIQTGDIHTFVNAPNHQGAMAGTVIAPALSDRPLTISDGVFNLFVQEGGHAGTAEASNVAEKRMIYRMQLNTYDGRKYFFSGYKKIEDDRGFDLWKDTTMLYITVFDGTDENAPVLGKGILKIQPLDFITQMTTVKALNAANTLDALNAIKSFSMFFSEQVRNTYFSKLF